MTDRKPKFAMDFVGFTTYGVSTSEATLVINPEYTITGVTEMQHSKDSPRGITLIFSRRKPKLGRRGYSLKQEWEQKPQIVGKESKQEKGKC